MAEQKASSWFWPLVVVAPVMLAALVVTAMPNRQMPGDQGTSARSSISPHDQLFGVTVTADRKCYIVGSRGLLLQSPDSGKRWSREMLRETINNSGQPVDLYSIAFSTDGKSGWITGEDGLILHSGDGGKSWAKQKAPVDGRLLEVAAISAQDACVVGDASLLWTADGGAHWQKGTTTPHPLPPFILSSVVFTDAKNGWAVGEFETILHTVDGGHTWEIQQGGELGGIDSIPYFAAVFRNNREGSVYGQDGFFETTVDGGRTWRKGMLNPKFSVFASALLDGKAYLVGARGMMMRCDENNVCEPQNPVPRDLADLSVAQGLGLAVGLGGTVLETRDGVKWSSIVGRRVD